MKIINMFWQFCDEIRFIRYYSANSAFTHGKFKKTKFFIDCRVHPQTIAVAQTRAVGLNAELVVSEWEKVVRSFF